VKKMSIVTFVVTSAVAMTIAGPVQANEALDRGLVRIDASWATVKTLKNESQVLTLDKKASGQWMGEAGVERQLVVREISDDQVVSGWNHLGHGRTVGVDATITWNDGESFSRVTVGNPELTPRGHVRFTLAPGASLPKRMANVDINMMRSPNPASRSYPVSESFALTATATASTLLNFAYEAAVSISDSGVTCYEVTLLQAAPIQEIPVNLECGSITFGSGQFTMTLPNSTQNGNVLFTSTMIASGSAFDFNSVIASWPLSG
jgi:hypothetical protein